MTVGASFLNLLGREDPRKALLQALASGGQAQGAAPQAGGGVPYADAQAGGGATAPTPGTDASSQSPQPQVETAQNVEAFKSPPDLSALFNDVLKRSSQESAMNTGLGLLGSSISQDENRSDTLKAFTGQDTGEGSMQNIGGMAGTIMEMNKAAIAQKQRAATLASLPAIAQRYGLTMEAATYLFNTGQLDKVIAEEEKPNNEIFKAADGTGLMVDKTNNKQIGTYGEPTPKEYKPQTLADGTIAPFDATTGTLGDPMGPVKPEDRTADQRNYDAYVTDEISRGNTNFMSFNVWDQQVKKAAANSVNVNEAAKMDPGLEAEKKKRGEKLGENYVQLQDASASASEQLSMFDAVEQGLKSGVRTGLAADAEQTFRKFGTLLGMDTDPTKIAGGELVTAVQNRMALQMRNPESGMGMPGSLSDKDIEFLKAAQIGMGTSGPGNETLMQVYRRLASRKIDLANLADEYVQGPGKGSMMGFGKYASEYNKLHPMFEDLKVGPANDVDRRKATMKKYGIPE